MIGAGAAGSAGSVGEGSGGSASAWTPAELTLDFWFDPANATTITYDTSPNVEQIDSVSGSEYCTQATGSNQPSIQSRGYGNALYFDGEHMDFKRARTNLKYLHDGTGMTLAIVANGTYWGAGHGTLYTLLDNLPLGDGTPGIRVRAQTGKLYVDVSDGNGSTFVLDSESGAVLTDSTVQLIVIRWVSPGNLEAWVDGTKVIDAAPSAVSSADPSFDMNLCASNSANEFTGDLAMMFGMKSKISDSDMSELESWASTTYGVTLP